MSCQRSRYAGFTLIEMLVTLSIIGILMGMVLPLAETTVKRGKEQELKHALRQIREGIDAYKRAADDGRFPVPSDRAGYPASLEQLVAGIEDQRDPKRRKLYFLRQIPRDPFADPTAAPEESWGKRSYASPHDDPRPGDDVYDIHSRSLEVGLNGVPYRLW